MSANPASSMLTPAAIQPSVYVGTCTRVGSWWLIACQSHVLIRIKRWFARIDPGERDQIRIRRSAEVDRDLQTFLDRFPMEMTPDDQVELHRGAEQHRAEAKIVARVLAGEYVPRQFPMAVEPRDYQRIAADLWLRRGNLLLGDQLGLGKTISAIAGLSDPSTRPALVVTPTHITHQWKEQLDRCLPGIRVHILQGTRPYDIAEKYTREARRAGVTTPIRTFPDVCVVNYHRIFGWADALRGRFQALVYDEVQELRGPKTERYSAARTLSRNTPRIIGLSGTPVYNYGAEFWNVMEQVSPGALGERDEFDRDWCVPGDEERKRRVKDPRAFGLYLRENGLMLRRTREDVGRELPPITVVTEHIGADLDELQKVSGTAGALARAILEQRYGKGAGLAKMQASSEFERVMRQATGLAKAPFVAAFAKMVIESGEKLVLFGWHREFWNILAAELKAYKPAFFTGEESETEKRAAVKRFCDPKDTPFLGVSLRAGTTGLDGLQYACSTVAIGELDWSPKIHDQGIGRVARDGQTKPVFAYILLADTGSDPVVADVCGIKRGQSDPISDPLAKTFGHRQGGEDHIRMLAEAVLAKSKKPDHGDR